MSCWLGADRARSVARTLQNRLRLHRLALISALEEFHRVQCFFGLAVQIAAITVMQTGSTAAATSTEAISNFEFMQLVAINTMLAIPLTLWYLQGNSERSWYTHLLSMVTFGTSLATYLMADLVRSRPWTYPLLQNNRFPKCGNIDPSSMCARNTIISFSNEYSMALVILPMTATFMIWLFLGQCWHRFLAEYCQNKRNLHRCLGAIRSFFLGSKRRRKVWTVLWILVKLHALGWFYAFVVVQFSQLGLVAGSGSVKTAGWSIGQIVGVTIWVQPILEFFHLDISKYKLYLFGFSADESGLFKHGFSHRVPKGLQVTEAPFEESEPLYPHGWILSVEDFFFGGIRPPRRLEPRALMEYTREDKPLLDSGLANRVGRQH